MSMKQGQLFSLKLRRHGRNFFHRLKFTNLMPNTLKKILQEAPLWWGIVALSEYRDGKKSVRAILQDWNNYKKFKSI